MNFSKVFTALLALGASANTTSMFVGAGALVGGTKPSASTSKKIINKKMTNAAALSNAAFKTNDAEGDDFGLDLNDPKMFIPAGAFVSGVVTFDNLVGALSLGFGINAGVRYNFNYENEGWYGDNTAAASAAVTKFAIKYPTYSFFVTPKVLIGADIAALHILLSVGLEMSYNAFKIQLNKGGTNKVIGDNNTVVAESDAKAWLFGVQFGLEGIYQVADCAGVGLGVHYTYWPEAMNNVAEKDLAKKFNNKAGETDDVFHVGGMWSVTGSLTGWFAFGA